MRSRRIWARRVCKPHEGVRTPLISLPRAPGALPTACMLFQFGSDSANRAMLDLGLRRCPGLAPSHQSGVSQITPTITKIAISTSNTAPVIAETRNQSPNRRNCMVRLTICQRNGPHIPRGVSRQELGAVSRKPDAFVRRQAP